jgi:hypothetical protein
MLSLQKLRLLTDTAASDSLGQSSQQGLNNSDADLGLSLGASASSNPKKLSTVGVQVTEMVEQSAQTQSHASRNDDFEDDTNEEEKLGFASPSNRKSKSSKKERQEISETEVDVLQVPQVALTPLTSSMAVQGKSIFSAVVTITDVETQTPVAEIVEEEIPAEDEEVNYELNSSLLRHPADGPHTQLDKSSHSHHTVGLILCANVSPEASLSRSGGDRTDAWTGVSCRGAGRRQR